MLWSLDRVLVESCYLGLGLELGLHRCFLLGLMDTRPADSWFRQWSPFLLSLSTVSNCASDGIVHSIWPMFVPSQVPLIGPWRKYSHALYIRSALRV